MTRITPVTKVDGASLIVYPGLVSARFPQGDVHLKEFKVKVLLGVGNLLDTEEEA